MIENLKKLKNRAENLQYSDQRELDDIIRKAKLYIGQIFLNKFEYSLEVGLILFKPLTTVYGMDDTHEKNCIKAWNDGKKSLINFIDTRIEEYEISIKKEIIRMPKTIIREKIVEVENTDKIIKLQAELERISSSKSFWEKVNWTTFLTTGLVVLGGTFLFGKYIGENRFDKEKIELNTENENLKNENLKLNDSIKNLNKSVITSKII